MLMEGQKICGSGTGIHIWIGRYCIFDRTLGLFQHYISKRPAERVTRADKLMCYSMLN